MDNNLETKVKELQIEISLLKKEIKRLKAENRFLRSNNPIEIPDFDPRDPPEIFKEEIEWKKVQSKPPPADETKNEVQLKKFEENFDKTTSANENLKELRIIRERYRDLGKIPYQAGAYILKFPNGKTYIGEALNLRIAVKKCLAELFPKPQTIAARKRNSRPLFKMSWMEEARKENKIFSYQDLEISAVVCQNPAYLKKRLLREIEGEHYNRIQ